MYKFTYSKYNKIAKRTDYVFIVAESEWRSGEILHFAGISFGDYDIKKEKTDLKTESISESNSDDTKEIFL